MISPLAILCCDELLQDATSRKVSLINLFDEINSAFYPTIHNRFSIWVKIKRDDGDARECLLEISLELDDEVLLAHNVNIDFVESFRHEALIKIGSIRLPNSGELIVKATIGDQSLFTRLYLRIVG